jgi:Cu(I)/Ag(I) efflux system membrane fusion protein
MINRTLALAAAAAIVALAAAGGYWLGTRDNRVAAPGNAGTASSPSASAPAPTVPTEAKTERKVLYWYDPMYPQQKFDRPGKSPFMDMQLVPRYADENGEAAGTVTIDPRVTQNLGVRTAAVERGSFERRVAAVGTVDADQHRIVAVQSRAAGWVEKLRVRAANDPVQRGQVLAEIYSPDILAAQEEYLLLLSSEGDVAMEDALRGAARDRLRYLGVSADRIDALERTRKADPRVPLFAPIGGIVSELGVREGSQVSPGMNLFTLVDLSSVWVHAQVPETQVAWIAPGRPIEARLKALPDRVFEGRVDYIYPEVDTATRTVRVRSVLRNRGLLLRPGMVAEVSVFGGAKRAVLTVPSEAVIYTGARTVVIAADGEGKFRALEVKTGMEANGRTEVLAGLEAGQNVVVSGQFLIDSEASLSSALTRLEGSAGAAQEQDDHGGHDAAPAAGVHRADGKIEHIDASGKVTLSHGPVPSLKWPPMTMDFAVQDKGTLAGFKAGQNVRFDFKQAPDGGYVIVRMEARP